MQHWIILCRSSLVLLLLSSALSVVHAQVSLALTRSTGSNFIGLSCLQNGITSNVATYHVRDNMEVVTQLQEPVNSQGTVLFELTPQTEGRYFCKVNNVNSEEQALVAYPEPVPSIAAITTAAVQRGQSVILQCEFELGRLSTSYSFEWFRNSTPFSPIVSSNPNGNIDPSKYQLLNDQSLQIGNAELDDTKVTYTCAVTVTIGNDIFRRGRTISLEVFDDVEIIVTHGITNEDQTVVEGGEAVFMCQASGVPTPSITWLSNGEDIPMFDEYQITSTIEGNIITSTLTVSPVHAENSANIACLAINSPRTREDTFNVSSSAILTVLSNDIEGLLLTTSQQENMRVVFIDFTLPAEILQTVTVIVKYCEEGSSATTRNDLTDSSFSNTREVHYLIPENNLPPYSSFRVTIALKVDTVEGPFTLQSNVITVPIGTPTTQPLNTSATPQADDGLSDSLLIAVTIGIIVIVLAVVAIIVIGVTCCVKYKCRVDEERARAGPPAGRQTSKPDGESEIELPWEATEDDRMSSRTSTDSTEDLETELPWETFVIIDEGYTSATDEKARSDSEDEESGHQEEPENGDTAVEIAGPRVVPDSAGECDSTTKEKERDGASNGGYANPLSDCAIAMDGESKIEYPEAVAIEDLEWETNRNSPTLDTHILLNATDHAEQTTAGDSDHQENGVSVELDIVSYNTDTATLTDHENSVL